jgi:hypothetical protein
MCWKEWSVKNQLKEQTNFLIQVLKKQHHGVLLFLFVTIWRLDHISERCFTLAHQKVSFNFPYIIPSFRGTLPRNVMDFFIPHV